MEIRFPSKGLSFHLNHYDASRAQAGLETSQSRIADINSIKITRVRQPPSTMVNPNPLPHEEHQTDARHQSPVDFAQNLLVQGRHLLIAQVSQSIETMLYLCWGQRKHFDLLFCDLLIMLIGLDGRV